jgi:TatD DNase family protein
MPDFYDTHAHLDYPDFTNDFPEMIARARAAGITRIISIGTDLESSHRAIQLAENHDCIYAVVGWHPNDAHSAPGDIRPALRELVRHPKVVAIGETGLDYYRLPSSRTPPGTAGDDEQSKLQQARVFTQQLEVAAESGLNVVIHQRGDCFEDTLRLFTPFAGKVRSVFHCFAGDTAALQRVLGLGSIVSFTGILTFKNGQNIRDALSAAPLGSFMLETDSPFLAPVPYRGKRCEPAFVRDISVVAAQVKACSLEELSRATCDTARKFFRNLAG